MVTSKRPEQGVERTPQELLDEWDSMPIWTLDPESSQFSQEMAKQYEALAQRPTASEDQDWVDSVSIWVEDPETE